MQARMHLFLKAFSPNMAPKRALDNRSPNAISTVKNLYPEVHIDSFFDAAHLEGPSKQSSHTTNSEDSKSDISISLSICHPPEIAAFGCGYEQETKFEFWSNYRPEMKHPLFAVLKRNSATLGECVMPVNQNPNRIANTQQMSPNILQAPVMAIPTRTESQLLKSTQAASGTDPGRRPLQPQLKCQGKQSAALEILALRNFTLGTAKMLKNQILNFRNGLARFQAQFGRRLSRLRKRAFFAEAGPAQPVLHLKRLKKAVLIGSRTGFGANTESGHFLAAEQYQVSAPEVPGGGRQSARNKVGSSSLHLQLTPSRLYPQPELLQSTPHANSPDVCRGRERVGRHFAGPPREMRNQPRPVRLDRRHLEDPAKTLRSKYVRSRSQLVPWTSPIDLEFSAQAQPQPLFCWDGAQNTRKVAQELASRLSASLGPTASSRRVVRAVRVQRLRNPAPGPNLLIVDLELAPEHKHLLARVWCSGPSSMHLKSPRDLLVNSKISYTALPGTARVELDARHLIRPLARARVGALGPRLESAILNAETVNDLLSRPIRNNSAEIPESVPDDE